MKFEDSMETKEIKKKAKFKNLILRSLSEREM